MSGSPIPPLQEELGNRPFAFYPPIRNIDYNEWQYLRATWSEVLVANHKAGIELWVPRRHFGAISSVDLPIPIVGLTKELEFRNGAVFPYHTKLLEMPGEPAERAQPKDTPSGKSGASIVNISLGSRNEGSVAKLIGVALAVALLAVFTTVAVYRGGGLFQGRVLLSTSDQEYLSFSRDDDYVAITKRLGKPAADRWNTRSKEVVFRVLEYPDRAYSVVLFGADQSAARYIGTMDRNWRPVHSVAVGRGVDSSAMLRSLPKF